jgi:hypothetical protein
MIFACRQCIFCLSIVFFKIPGSINNGMSVITLYRIPQVIVLTTGTGATLMNYPVNQTDFTIYRNVDNEIDFLVKNIDRRAISFADSTARIHITDTRQQRLLVSRDLIIVDEEKGHLRLFLTGAESAALPIKTLSYSVVLTRADNVQVLLFTDRSRKSSGTAMVADGPLPDPIDPIELTLEDFLIREGVYYSGALPGSVMVDNETGFHSVVFNLTGFTGILTAQGSLELSPSQDDGLWFPMATQTLSQHTGLYHIPFEGQVNWVRFVITKAAGDVTAITFRN